MTGRHLTFAIPGDLDTPSGGYRYDRRLIAELRGLGWTVDHLGLPPGFPEPNAHELATVAAEFSGLPDGALVLVDGLAFGAMPEIARHEAKRLRLVALVHHPLALETGLNEPLRRHLEESEREALAAARAVIVTSPATGRTLRLDFSVPGDHLTVAPPGTDRPSSRPPKPARGEDDPLVILSIGTVSPRKDHETLVAALAQVADCPWRCRIVGSTIADPQTAGRLAERITTLGLEGRIELAGAQEDVTGEYAEADLFALASRYEGYGMVFAEAMANGLPIVYCAEGAPRDLIPRKASRRFPPGDVEAMAAALRAFFVDDDLRRQAADAARHAAEALPTWRDTGTIVADRLVAVAQSA